MSHRWISYLRRLNPSCRDVMGWICRDLDLDLDRVERLIVAIHGLHCPACRRSRRQILWLVSALRRHSRQSSSEAVPGLPRGVRERIIRTLREG